MRSAGESPYSLSQFKRIWKRDCNWIKRARNTSTFSKCDVCSKYKTRLRERRHK